MATRTALYRRLAGYAVSRGATEAILAVRGVVLAVLLGPAAFGTWALLRLAMRYSSLVALSVYRGLELEAFQRQADSGNREIASGAALGFVLVVSGLLSKAALVASFIVTGPEMRLLLRAFAAASLAEAVYGFALVCMRVQGNLRRYSLFEAATALLHLVAAGLLGWRWGLAGAFLGLATANLVGIALASRWIELKPRIDPGSVRRMLRVGLPVVLTMLVGILLATGDRWIVAVWGGSTMLGYYAFAGSVTTAAGALAIVVRTVVFPQVYGDASSLGSAAALRSHLDGILVPFARLLPPLLGAVGLALAPLVAAFAPSYTEAIAPARIFLLAGAAMALVNIASVGAVAAGEQRRMPGYAAIALALTGALSVAALTSGLGLGGVAGATFAGHLLFAALLLRLNVRESGLPEANRVVGTLLWPLVWCTGAVWISSRMFAGVDSLSALQGLAIYLLLLVPLAAGWWAEWRRVGSGSLQRI